jgi:hypothetical protein
VLQRVRDTRASHASLNVSAQSRAIAISIMLFSHSRGSPASVV